MNLLVVLLALLFPAGCGSELRSLADPSVRDCIRNVLDPEKRCTAQEPPTPTSALIGMRNKWIYFVGESTLRQMFYQYLGFIKEQDPSLVKDDKKRATKEKSVTVRISGSRFTFQYLPYFRNITDFMKPENLPILWGRPPDLIVANTGLHDLLYNSDKRKRDWSELEKALGEHQQSSQFHTPILWISMPQLHDDLLSAHRKESLVFRNSTVFGDNTLISSTLEQYKSLPKRKSIMYMNTFLKFKEVEEPTKKNCNPDGVHSMQRARWEAEGFVNAVTWLNEGEYFHERAVTTGQVYSFLMFFVSLGIVVLAEGSQWAMALISTRNGDVPILYKAVSQSDEFSMETDGKPKKARESPMPGVEMTTKGDTEGNIELGEAPPGEDGHADEQLLLNRFGRLAPTLQYYNEHKTDFRYLLIFFTVIGLAYLCDGPKHAIFDPMLKPTYSRDFFLFLHVIILIMGYMTLTPTFRNKDDLYSRDLGEEWKGVMQISFVLYHYFDAGETYNMIRVFIACYVWMTGFGNASYFLKYKFFGFARFGYMMFRLNWLVFWMCLVLDEEYMLYYICPLHTSFFLMTYATMAFIPKWNHRIDESGIEVYNYKWLLTKLVLCLGVLVTMFEVPGMFMKFWDWPWWDAFLSYYGSYHEWEFRMTLDHYSTWLGMLCCLGFPYWNNAQRWVESRDFYLKYGLKTVATCVTCTILLLWWTNIFPRPKFDYNAIHPYTSWMPTLGYLILRNMSQRSRRVYSSWLAYGGRITLETYILQYHFYMLDDAKSILVLIPGYRLINFLAVTVLYVLASKAAFDATQSLSNWLLPQKLDKKTFVPNGAALCNIGRLLGLVGAGYFVSYLLRMALFR